MDQQRGRRRLLGWGVFGGLVVASAVAIGVVVATQDETGAARGGAGGGGASAVPAITVSRVSGRSVFVTGSDILFDLDSTQLRPEAPATLRATLTQITSSGATGAITVEGYTDNIGSEDYNRRLSGDRAAAVRTWLIYQGGLDASRITVAARGTSSPAQSNDTEQGRQANRRVVITVAP